LPLCRPRFEKEQRVGNLKLGAPMLGQATVYILNNLMQFGLLNSENWRIEYRIAPENEPDKFVA